jgi:hypothetical protein
VTLAVGTVPRIVALRLETSTAVLAVARRRPPAAPVPAVVAADGRRARSTFRTVDRAAPGRHEALAAVGARPRIESILRDRRMLLAPDAELPFGSATTDAAAQAGPLCEEGLSAAATLTPDVERLGAVPETAHRAVLAGPHQLEELAIVRFVADLKRLAAQRTSWRREGRR